jgi:hypothetical protein
MFLLYVTTAFLRVSIKAGLGWNGIAVLNVWFTSLNLWQTTSQRRECSPRWCLCTIPALGMESEIPASQSGFYFKFSELRAQNIRTDLHEFPDRVLLPAETEQSLPKNEIQLLLNSNNPRESRLGTSWLRCGPRNISAKIWHLLLTAFQSLLTL